MWKTKIIHKVYQPRDEFQWNQNVKWWTRRGMMTSENTCAFELLYNPSVAIAIKYWQINFAFLPVFLWSTYQMKFGCDSGWTGSKVQINIMRS